MVKVGKHLIKDLVVTAVASPVLILLLVLVRARTLLSVLVTPSLDLGREIGAWIDSVFPPQGGEWFQGLGTVLAVDFVLVWIEVWIVLFAALELFQKLRKRRKNKA